MKEYMEVGAPGLPASDLVDRLSNLTATGWKPLMALEAGVFLVGREKTKPIPSIASEPCVIGVDGTITRLEGVGVGDGMLWFRTDVDNEWSALNRKATDYTGRTIRGRAVYIPFDRAKGVL